MNITLYEKIDRVRVLEVLECDNIPFEETDTQEWKSTMMTKLKNYAKKKLKNGKVEIEYKQKNKWGRYYSSNGYQGFKREIRKYLNNEN